MPTFRLPFEAMASYCEVVLDAADQAQAARMAKEKYSRYRPDSVVARINGAAGSDWVDCDAEMQMFLAPPTNRHHHEETEHASGSTRTWRARRGAGQPECQRRRAR
ncbi:MAG: hypothetical protein V4582_17475 [Pseudomonadota bacterium]